MPPDETQILLVRLDERFKSLEVRLERHEMEMRQKLEAVDEVLDNLNRLALYGRVSLGILVTVGTTIGWFIGKWQEVRGVFGK